MCYGQKDYQFDMIVKNTFSTQSFPNQERIRLFNSDDDSYHMMIYNRNDSLMSKIFDTKENQAHYFYIDKLDSLKLKYLRTKTSTKKILGYKFEFSEIKRKKGSKEMIFKIFNNRNKKIARYKLKIKETDKNLFSIFKLSVFDPILFDEIVTSIDFMVLEAKGTNTNGRFINYKLESIEDISLNVKIPD